MSLPQLAALAIISVWTYQVKSLLVAAVVFTAGKEILDILVSLELSTFVLTGLPGVVWKDSFICCEWA